MTTLYRPVPIESAEQAEALPVGTVAIESGEQGQTVGASVRVRGGWYCTGYCLDFGGAETLKHSDMVGDQALVPIEAEQEYAVRLGSEGGMILPVATHEPAPGHGGVNNLAHLARYVTPWEEA